MRLEGKHGNLITWWLNSAFHQLRLLFLLASAERGATDGDTADAALFGDLVTTAAHVLSSTWTGGTSAEAHRSIEANVINSSCGVPTCVRCNQFALGGCDHEQRVFCCDSRSFSVDSADWCVCGGCDLADFDRFKPLSVARVSFVVLDTFAAVRYASFVSELFFTLTEANSANLCSVLPDSALRTNAKRKVPPLARHIRCLNEQYRFFRTSRSCVLLFACVSLAFDTVVLSGVITLNVPQNDKLWTEKRRTLRHNEDMRFAKRASQISKSTQRKPLSISGRKPLRNSRIARLVFFGGQRSLRFSCCLRKHK